MYKGIGIALTMAAFLGFAPLSQAATIMDFETPTYSLGNLSGQDGWSGAGGSVVAKPSFLPASAGAQSAAINVGATASKSLAGAGFTDTTQFSALWGFDITQLPTNYWYSDMCLSANDGTSVKPFALFGAEWMGGPNQFYAHNGSTPVEAPGNSAWNAVPTYLADVTLNFTTQQYKAVFKDAATSAVLYDFGWFAFKNPITLAQAEASGALTFDIGSSGGGWTAYLDNVTINVPNTPEPSSLTILVTALTGLLAYAWRKRK